MGSRAENLPNGKKPNVTAEEMSSQVRLLETVRAMPTVDYTSNDEIRERLRWFFEFCADNEIKPGVELMALSLGIHRQTLWEWSCKNDERGRILKTAKQTLAALLEQWALNNQINPVTAIFQMKNHFGYQDTVTVEETKSKLEELPTRDDIIRRLPNNVIDEDEDIDNIIDEEDD